MARAIGIDVGERRVGVAISDVTRTLARPLMTLRIGSTHDAVERVAEEVQRLIAEEDGVSTIVVGLPVRLDGSRSEQTSHVEAFVAGLKQKVLLPIVCIDERLSSIEAESRIAARIKDWKARKQKLDSAAAAVILQDYLDRPQDGRQCS